MSGTTMLRSALALLTLSAVLFLAGFCSSHWFRSEERDIHFGLWTLCVDNQCVAYSSASVGHAYVGRSCGIAQLVLAILSFVFLALFMFKAPRAHFVKKAYITAFAAGIVGFLGAVVFIGREKSLESADLGIVVSWSGILVILAALMEVGVGVLILLPVQRGAVEFTEI